jgi:hypothetical protein
MVIPLSVSADYTDNSISEGALFVESGFLSSFSPGVLAG